jgi:hypothetical protein
MMFDPEILMKTKRAKYGRRPGGQANRLPRRQGERGMAMIAVVTIIALVLMYVAANLRSLQKLGRGLDRIEKRQIQRLEMAGAVPDTNAVPPAPVPAAKPEAPASDANLPKQ